MKFIRRTTTSDYIADQVIPEGGGTVEDVPITPTDALEVELDDGSTYVLLGYKRK